VIGNPGKRAAGPSGRSDLAPSRLNSLQAGRFIASMAVVLYHLDLLARASSWYGRPIHPLLHGGSAGVEYFFVLSGFLMTWLYGNRLGEPGLARRFLGKRVARIYPVYWLVLVPLIPVYFLLPSMGEGFERNPIDIVTSFFLLPWTNSPILGVAWTLRYEMWFYLLFAALIAWPRVMLALFAVYLLAIASGLLANGDFPIRFFFNQFILLFFYGIAAAVLARAGRDLSPPITWSIAGMGLTLFCLALAGYVYGYLPRVLERNALGVGAALVLFGLARLDDSRRLHTPCWLTYLGDASYALYLIHYPVLSIGGKLVAATPFLSDRPAISIPLLAALALASGVGLHEIGEKLVLGKVLPSYRKWSPQHR
jgi:peptidoglycan/LPS O-acetylase OafA/YrhL